MGLLGDLYSTIDSKKRQLRGLLSDPLETIYQGVRNIGNDWNGLLDTQAQAYPFIPRTQDQQARIQAMARTPEQARKELADQGANMGIAAATVWHGSPHKFDKFDSSKIGTGEGAQAYGHGLYLADAPDVAQSYAGKAAAQIDKRADGSFLAMVLDPSGKPVAKKSFLDKTAAMDFAKAEQSKFGYGSLYKVDLPDEHIAKMLDWDKPLSQQAPEVRSTLNGIMSNEAPDFWKAFKLNDRTGGRAQNEVAKRYGVPSNELSLRGGEGALRAIEDVFGKSNSAADLLRKQGIPGIRYLDGGSRGAGTGTSNYVVFPGNEDILKILERNGQPLGLLD